MSFTEMSSEVQQLKIVNNICECDYYKLLQKFDWQKNFFYFLFFINKFFLFFSLL